MTKATQNGHVTRGVMVRDHLNTHQTDRTITPSGSLNFSGPQIDRARFLHKLEHTTEIEAKYFVPKEVLSPLVKGRECAHIEQRYFPSNRVRAIVEEFKDILKISDPEAFSSARIRRLREPNGSLVYYIESKGKKQGKDDARISRREATATISAATYKRLKRVATAGILRKRRYNIQGNVETEDGKVPVTAHLDVIQAAGKNIRKLKASPSTIDVELARAEHIRYLRAGLHSFAFLAHCVEITAKSPKEQKILATRLIAKHGIQDEQATLLKKLTREARELRAKHG